MFVEANQTQPRMLEVWIIHHFLFTLLAFVSLLCDCTEVYKKGGVGMFLKQLGFFI
jgi:hypothetical protein